MKIRPRITTILILLALASPALHAQITTFPSPRRTPAAGGVKVEPEELYAGDNIVTVTCPDGIKDIQANYSRLVRVTEGDGPGRCATTRQLKVFCSSSSSNEPASLTLLITDCKGREHTSSISNRTWQLDQNVFGRVEPGETVCQEFTIRTNAGSLAGGSEILDSVTVPQSTDCLLSLRLPTSMPYRIRPNEVYRYTVCITANKTGTYKFPVITWMRRRFPVGNLTTYPVADTGVARVVPPRKEDPPPPPPVRDTTRRTPPPPVLAEPAPTDPTTFRSVGVPNAVIPKKGRFVVGNYDLLGLMAGYSLSDNVMVLAGGALPTPDDWSGVHGEMFGAYSIGVKAGLKVTSNLNIAAGYQFARSIYDKGITRDTVESKITIHAPYAAISFGDDDSRVSLTGGYAFKHHTAVVPDGRISDFDEDAAFVALGGDYRFAKNWKIAGEVMNMRTLGVVPIVATARYFTNSYAFDFGVAFVGITTGNTAAPKIPLAPVISAVFVF